MALTDEQIEILEDAIVPLFSWLEQEVIRDVARRIKKTMTYTRTAELQAMSMRELGYSPAKIRKEAMKLLNADSKYRKEVAKNTLEYKKEIKKLIEEIVKQAKLANDDIIGSAGNMAWIDDLNVWKDNGITLTDNSFLSGIVDAYKAQTGGLLKNLTNTTGFQSISGFEPIKTLYRTELDKAIIKITTGTFDRETVLKDIVHNLAQSGIRSIDYASGRTYQLDTAARMAIRTGCNQLAAKVSDKNMENTGVNLVYVSKHWGARNKGTGHANHEEWQGKVYYFGEYKQEYDNEAERIGQEKIDYLWEATGYSADGKHENDIVGLHGVNCRHRHHPWFIGASTIPKETPEPDPIIYNGKKYDYYAVTQNMRAMERGIRSLKRERDALKSLGLDEKEINTKIRKKTREYHDFCEYANVNPQPERLRYESGTADLKKTKAWSTYKQVVNDGKNGIIKSITVDDLLRSTDGSYVNEEVAKEIVHILEKHDASRLYDTVKIVNIGENIVFQTEPIKVGTFFDTVLNINVDMIGGKSVEEINQLFKTSGNTVCNSLEDAIVHEMYHAKLISGLGYAQMESLYEELDTVHIEGFSSTAYKDGTECIAEVGVMIERGEIDKVPKDALDLFKKYMR